MSAAVSRDLARTSAAPAAVSREVVLVAHGAGDDSRANAQLLERARRLQEHMPAARVQVAFLRGRPSFDEVLQRADRARRVVIPMFSAEGFYVARLRDTVQRLATGIETVVTDAIGSHPLVVAAVVRMVGDAITHADVPVRDVVVVVVGHGTSRHPRSGTSTQRAAQSIAEQLGVVTHTAFLDQAPEVETVVRALAPHTLLLVVPYLIGGGLHALADVPERVHSAHGDTTTHDANAGADRRVVVLPPVGSLEAIDTLLLRLAGEHAP